MFEPPTRNADLDEPIRATDNDAAIARLSAVQKGYLTDPYIAPFVPRAHLQQPRPPLINIGTYLRARGIDHLLDGWFRLSGERKVQIVSLGAGSDTRFWRLADGPHAVRLKRYIEIDFAENTSRKALAIRRSRALSAALGGPNDISIGEGGTALRSPVYNLLPVDLRTPPAASLAPLLASNSGKDDEPLLSPSLPTLLLFECVLAYMAPDASNALIRWFANHFAAAGATAGPLGGVVYEMFKLNDAFGRVMLNNLKSRGVLLPGAEPHTDITSLSRRFLDLGFTTAQALTLREIRRTYVESRELRRIAQLEMLDEVEELELVLDHYAISWGVRFPDENWALEGGNTWGLVRKDQVENENDDS